MDKISPPLFFFPIPNALSHFTRIMHLPSSTEYFDKTTDVWEKLPFSFRSLSMLVEESQDSWINHLHRSFLEFNDDYYETALEVLSKVAFSIKALDAKQATADFFSTGWRGFAQQLIDVKARESLESIYKQRPMSETFSLYQLYQFLSILYCLDEMDLLSNAQYRSISQYVLSLQFPHGAFENYHSETETRSGCQLESSYSAILAILICDYASYGNAFESINFDSLCDYLVSHAERRVHSGCSYCDNGICSRSRSDSVIDAYYLVSMLHILSTKGIQIDLSNKSKERLKKRANTVIPLPSLLKVLSGPASDNLYSWLSRSEIILLHSKKKQADFANILNKVSKPSTYEGLNWILETLLAFTVHDMLSDNIDERASLLMFLLGTNWSTEGILYAVNRCDGRYMPFFLPYISRWLPGLSLGGEGYQAVFEDDKVVPIQVQNVGSKKIEKVRVDLGVRLSRTGKKRLFATSYTHFGALKGSVRTLDEIRPLTEDRLVICFDRNAYTRRIPKECWPGYGVCTVASGTLTYLYSNTKVSTELRYIMPPLAFLPCTRGEFNQLLERLSTKWSFDDQELARNLQEELGLVLDNRSIDFGALIRSVNKPRFYEWLRQFNDSQKKLAFRLYAMLTVYSPDMLRDALSRLFANLPEDYHTKGAAVSFVGLGNPVKSGPHLMYYFRQANRRFIVGEQVITVNDIERQTEQVKKSEVFVFVDDFVGSGGQAARTNDEAKERDKKPGFLTQLYAKNPWINDRDVFFLTVCGMRQGIQYIQNRYPGVELRCDKVLNKAFDDKRISEDVEERNVARAEFQKIGERILPESYDSVHALGWDGSEALVVFPYNSPNNTLPIFWSSGNRRKQWINLYPRIEP